MRNRFLLIAAFVALAGASFAFTKQGRTALIYAGLAKACSSEGNCD